jgi:hypothetical protein
MTHNQCARKKKKKKIEEEEEEKNKNKKQHDNIHTEKQQRKGASHKAWFLSSFLCLVPLLLACFSSFCGVLGFQRLQTGDTIERRDRKRAKKKIRKRAKNDQNSVYCSLLSPFHYGLSTPLSPPLFPPSPPPSFLLRWPLFLGVLGCQLFRNLFSFFLSSHLGSVCVYVLLRFCVSSTTYFYVHDSVPPPLLLLLLRCCSALLFPHHFLFFSSFPSFLFYFLSFSSHF